MKRIVLDIETVGVDFDSLDDISKEYLLKGAQTDEERQKVFESLSFYPLTAQVAAIGILDLQTNKTVVFFQAPGENIENFKEGDKEFVVGDEKEILERFWKALTSYDQIVTFNGRGFDAPFLMIRSGINKVRPAKNLMPNRYSSEMHIDLMDRLSFFGSMRKYFPLHMWCKAFGIKSPKEEGIFGYQVAGMFKQKKFKEIARYCAKDLDATKELFEYWDKFLSKF